jgi:serine/threonine protein phosphatase PrpC
MAKHQGRSAAGAPTPRKPRWQALGQSVRGAAHARAGLPNQDAYTWVPRSGEGSLLILAVSDGHGSAKSFRSDVGSGYAVSAAAWVLQDLLDGQPDPRNLSAIKRTAEERLPQEIVRHWTAKVEEHLQKTPFTEEELGALEQKDGPAARQKVEDNPLLAYGATLLATLVAEDFILYLQLGDGDILVVSEEEEVSRPMPEDARLFANQTTSLCTPDAWRDFRIRFQTVVGSPPALILLATDGYANSFVNEEAFLQVATDIWEIIRDEGLATVTENLEGWLERASQEGSGDDITLGLLCRLDLLPTDEERSMIEALLDAAVKDELADEEEELPTDAVPDSEPSPPPEPADFSELEEDNPLLPTLEPD